jgi:2-dehydro-3-deoxygluconokinase
LQSPILGATFGGGEATVAVGLAQFGLDSQFVTRLPENAIGDAALRALRSEGVGVAHVQRGGERMGIYFTETGAGQRPSSVVYDRKHSALSQIEPAAIRWPEVLEGAAWFHLTGITPALGPGPAACTRAALVAAREAGVTVSFDINYRSRLWTEAEAQRALRPLMQYVDVLIANEEHTRTVLGVPIAGTEPEAYAVAAARVAAEHGCRHVALTLRESISASENGWSALLYHVSSKRLVQGPRYVLNLVDRIGGGDSFAAGLIFALLDGRPLEKALAFAVAAGALKQTVPGDFNRVSVAEVERLAAGDQSGRVRR